MLQNLISNVFLRNRPTTPFVHAFTGRLGSQIENRPYTSFRRARNFKSSTIPSEEGRRRIFTSPPLGEAKKTDAGKQTTGEAKAAGEELVTNPPVDPSRRPPWPPFGPPPSCCKPVSDQSCATIPPSPLPRNPNPFFNEPRPCIRDPPPPWCGPPKEVPAFCPMPPSPPLAPVSFFMQDLEDPSAEHEPPPAKEFVLQPMYDFDVFDEMKGVLYEEEGGEDEYYAALSEYFEPEYKNLEYHSYGKNSFADIGVHLKKFYSFMEQQKERNGTDGKGGK